MHNHKLTSLHNVAVQQHGDTTWIDVSQPSNEVFKVLETEYRLHPVHLKESVQKVQHNQVEREDNYLFLVLHVPTREAASSAGIAVRQVGVFLGKDYLITIQNNNNPVVRGLFERYTQQSNEAKEDFSQGSAYVLYKLINNILTDISTMIEKVEDELDGVETLVFDNSSSDAQVIGKLRQKIIRLRRVIGPKRLLLQDLDEQIDSFSGYSMSKYYSNNTKFAARLWEIAEEAKDTIEIFKDADFTTSTEKTNKVLAVLTIVFTFTIPITVVGTLYGMNVPIPGGTEAGAWTFWGTFTTFELVVIISSLMALGMYWYFSRKKWF